MKKDGSEASFGPGASDEVTAHGFGEAVLGADWTQRFRDNSAGYRDLSAAYAGEQDPQEVVGTAEQKGAALLRTLGSAVISLHQCAVVAERQAFETEFGQQ
ncbi:MAG TPA: hypothetical protein VMR45_01115 [Patescibacteria group bacterium]|nr:hypothetical protein [Patescibacteria group bacterium]